MGVPVWLPFGLVGVLLLVGACEAPPEHTPILAAYAELRDAVARRDAGRLFDMAEPQLATELDELARRLDAAEALVEDRFTPVEARQLWRQLGLELLDAGRDGRAVFVALGAFSAFRYGPEVERGFEPEAVVLQGDAATVRTLAGETFDFRKGADGRWLSTLPYSAWRAWSDRQRLIDNLEQLDANVARMVEQRHLLRDPRTVAGALNRLRDAVVAKDVPAVYTLLDSKSRGRLDALVDVRSAKPHPEADSPPSAERPDVAPEEPALREEETSERWRAVGAHAPDGRALLGALLAAGILDEFLPTHESDRIRSEERIASGRARVTLEDGRSLVFVREEQDVWRCECLSSWLDAARAKRGE